MGSRYFKHCRPDQRFTVSGRMPHWEYGTDWLIEDWDQRRILSVHTPNEKDDKDFVFESLASFIDDIDPDVVLVTLAGDGALKSSSSDFTEDRTEIPFYPSRTDYPPEVPTLRRRDLVEVDRLGFQVDRVTYQPNAEKPEAKHVVFKYYIAPSNIVGFWHEANCVMRIPRHPNIVPFDSLVVDTVEGADKVVGFTTRYIHGGTLSENKDRVFKLKYLKELMSVVDYLNLRLGVVHGDICPWNILIDPDTDSIRLFDFNCGAKLGWEGDRTHSDEFKYEEDRNDVKFVVFTLYEIITREYSFRGEFYPHELKTSKVLRKREWKQHSDVRLDSPVSEYRRILKAWLDARKKKDKEINHFSKALEPLNWPPVPDFPPTTRLGQPAGFPVDTWADFRSTLIQYDKDFLKWQRLPSRALPLPQGQRLLATGEVVGDGQEDNTSVKK